MVDVGKDVLQKNNVTDLTDARLVTFRSTLKLIYYIIF